MSFPLALVFCVLARSPMPMDAQLDKASQAELRDALLATSKLSTLEGEGGRPFRLKAKFATYDHRGNLAGEGTVEETWLRPGVRRRVITFRGNTQTQVNLDVMARTIGSGFGSSLMERRVVAALFTAAPTSAVIKAALRLNIYHTRLDKSLWIAS